MSFKFGRLSTARLKTCNLQLQDLFNTVIQYRDCSVLCGHRTEEKQNLAYPTHSNVQWPNSMHNSMPSQAVDVVPYPIDWEDIPRFHEFAGFVMGIAIPMGISIKWGGHFKSFFDGPHYEIIHK